MATTYTKTALSGSTNGKLILIVQTATAGTAIHTAVAGTTNWDEVWLYAINNHTAAVNLTIEWGDATAPNNNITCAIASKQGLYLLVPGFVLQNGATIKAFATTPNVISIGGWVNNIVVA
jgi:hypothetical protein